MHWSDVFLGAENFHWVNTIEGVLSPAQVSFGCWGFSVGGIRKKLNKNTVCQHRHHLYHYFLLRAQFRAQTYCLNHHHFHQAPHYLSINTSLITSFTVSLPQSVTEKNKIFHSCKTQAGRWYCVISLGNFHNGMSLSWQQPQKRKYHSWAMDTDIQTGKKSK